MAIQVWDEKAGHYRGVELARYGADGVLAEALVWDQVRYRRVWPTSNDFTDDFTSPTLHSRWTLMDGTYSPPGLSGIVQGPLPAPDFEASIGLPATPYPEFMLAVMDMMTSTGVMLVGSIASGYAFGDPMGQHTFWNLVHEDYAWSTVTLRRFDGAWSVYADGQPVRGVDGLDPSADPDNPVPVEVPDPFPGQQSPLIVGGWESIGSGDTLVRSVTYTEL